MSIVPVRSAISLYTGAGGLDLGFEAAGIATRVAVEMDADCVATLNANRDWPVLAGIQLPGLYFRNQRVEAAYRKELVYGEDDASRAELPTLGMLFSKVRRNYFRLYFHYFYFNIVRYTYLQADYLQADNIFVYLILVPTIAAGKVTFGILQQILTAFVQVSSSFQYLVNSWTTLVELQSIHKRLAAFEAAFERRPFAEPDSVESILPGQTKAAITDQPG